MNRTPLCAELAITERNAAAGRVVSIAALLSVMVFFAATASAQSFSTPVNISSAVGGGLPLIAVDSKNDIDIAWAGASPTHGVFFTRSTDGGKNFASPTTVSPSYFGGESLQMVVDPSGDIYLFWQRSDQHYVFSASNDGGASFSAPTDLSTALGMGTFTANLPTMALDPKDNIDLVWAQFGSPEGPILFSRYTDGGFSAPVTVGTFGYAAGPQIGFDPSGNIYVLWFEEMTEQGGTCLLRFSRSTSSGASFSPTQTLNTADGECNPQLFVDAAGNINVLSFDGNGTYYRSSDGGPTFSTTGGAFQPVYAGFGGQFHANGAGGIDTLINGFLPPNGPEHDLFFNRSSDNGSMFSTPVMIGGSHTPSTTPEEIGASEQSMTVDGSGNVNVLYDDDTFSTQPGVADVFFSRSTDGGVTFSKPQNLSNSTVVSSAPKMALDSAGNINAVWASSDASNIFFSRGSVSGTTASFTMSTAPTPLVALPGGTAAARVTLTATGGFDEAVNLGCGNLPAGAECSFDPASATPTSTGTIVTLTMTIPPTLPAGGFPFTITATSPFTVQFENIEAAVGVMTGSVAPTAATIPVGGTANFTITMTGANGVSGQFNLGCNAPAGVTCTFTPSSVFVPFNGRASATLTAQVGNVPATGLMPTNPGDIFPAGLPPVAGIGSRAKRDILPIWGLAVLLLGALALALARGRQRGRRTDGRFAVARTMAGMAMTLALAAMLSCGGATSKATMGGGNTGTSSPNVPAGSTSVTFPMTVTAQSGPSVVDVGTITVTVP